MLRIFFFVLALALGQTSAMASALFSTEVVLDDSDTATEQTAKQKAFVDVLVRMSGQSNVGENPVIQKALPSVNQYITQLGYGESEGLRSLVLAFDDAKIRTLLTQAQVPYWGLPRPEVLFWLVEDSASQRNVVWEQSGSDLITTLKAEGERRGLPVLMPVGDFDDVVAISIPDLWGGFTGPISQASTRYNPTGVAVVKVRNNRLSWQLFPNAANIGGDAPIEGQVSGAPAQAFATMVDDISNYYAERLAINLGVADSNATALTITGLNDAEDFFVVERTLKGLNSVASLRLASIESGTATFRISLLANEEIFHNEMMSDRRLRRVEVLPEPVVETLPTPTPAPTQPVGVNGESQETIDGVIVPVIEEPALIEAPQVTHTDTSTLTYQWVG
ncbi:DUF2066 domain-containing protein [Enterovibrio calviensis]|uniref:DUF2066 domain-containing protein n=1 Tax=Enterovibrio calviensis TaxID=91359 RepID=UPI001FE1DC7B|nr:DUF2066 domain-containing protein [Enterovibrio calviensis]